LCRRGERVAVISDQGIEQAGIDQPDHELGLIDLDFQQAAAGPFSGAPRRSVTCARQRFELARNATQPGRRRMWAAGTASPIPCR
jgi:hypothetical protein